MIIETEPHKERLQLWVEALRSEEFARKQTTGCLIRDMTRAAEDGYCPTTDAYTEGGKYAFCCLGVAAVVALRNGFVAENFDWGYGVLPWELRDWYGLPDRDPTLFHEGKGERATGLNDDAKLTFPEIASAIERTYELSPVSEDTPSA